MSTFRRALRLAFPWLARPYKPWFAAEPKRPEAPRPRQGPVDRFMEWAIAQNDVGLRDALRHVRPHAAAARELERLVANQVNFPVEQTPKRRIRDPRLLAAEQYEVDNEVSVDVSGITRNDYITAYIRKVAFLDTTVGNWLQRRQVLQYYRDRPDAIPEPYDTTVVVPPRMGFGGDTFAPHLSESESRLTLGFALDEVLTEERVTQRFRLLNGLNSPENRGSAALCERLDLARALLVHLYGDQKLKLPGEDEDKPVLDPEEEALVRQREKEIQDYHEERMRSAQAGYAEEDDEDLPPEEVAPKFARGTTEEEKARWKEEQRKDRLRRKLVREAMERAAARQQAEDRAPGVDKEPPTKGPSSKRSAPDDTHRRPGPGGF